MTEWRIYYGDGTTFDDNQSGLSHAPCVNVQCIVSKQPDGYRTVADVGRVLIYGWDYYIYKTGVGWFGVKGESDLIDHIMHDVGDIHAVLKARSIDIVTFKELFQTALADPDFPKKTSWLKDVEAPELYMDGDLP